MASRRLKQEERAAAEEIFGAGLDYSRVWVNEGMPLPNWVGWVGATIKRQDPPTENAITVGNTSFFPAPLQLTLRDLGWLMHELTHQWQYQHYGARYIADAIFAPTYVYADPGENLDDALKRLTLANKTFHDLNREQQGDVVRDYFFALRQPNAFVLVPRDLTAWDPYLAILRQSPR